ncbi:hypothetical protein [Schumannella sp. 10F1B-5-1]|uniref:hypothetical protein n=1 Tax=Schumannella sp. 10F1B-5-1 TaxID=2590780 RepID=UPI00113278A9|nr:hypothetical protein [Schumannella sp. 10F1B-5-1]TPW78430.1 hypothetical protein FJ658_01090 [Schumannella sp. 10F1B-5-1]
MDWVIFLGIVIVAIPVLVLAQRRGWIELRGVERPGGSMGALGAADEVFSPTRHEAAIELDAQTRLSAPAPLPGDPARLPGGFALGTPVLAAPVLGAPAAPALAATSATPTPPVGSARTPHVPSRPEPLLTGAIRIRLDLPPVDAHRGRHAA